MRFRDKLARFMYGRNGSDQLGQAEALLILILIIAGLFLRNSYLGSIVYLLSLAGFVHMYFRMFSKNLEKRRKENQWFLNLRYNRAVNRNKRKIHAEQKKIYRFFKCPMCSQKVRVPKGKGKICITCPKCREEFVRKS